MNQGIRVTKRGTWTQSVHFKNHVFIYAHLQSSLQVSELFYKIHGPLQGCTSQDKSAAEQNGYTREKEWCWGGRGHLKSTWWSLYFMPVCHHLFFFFSNMYVFFYQQRIMWTNMERRWSDGCGNNLGKNVLTECFSQVVKTLDCPPLSKDNQLLIVRAGVGEMVEL